MADVTVTEAGPHEKLISFEVAEAELEPAKNAAARKISQEVKIRGFRPGKAPRAIVEATVGAERLRNQRRDTKQFPVLGGGGGEIRYRYDNTIKCADQRPDTSCKPSRHDKSFWLICRWHIH